MSNSDNIAHLISFLGNRISELEKRIEGHEKSDVCSRIDQMENIIYLRNIHTFSDFLRLRLGEFANTLERLLGIIDLSDRRLANRLRRLKNICEQSDVAEPRVAGAEGNPASRTIYIDITQTVSTDKVSGISRVSKELALSAIKLGAVPVFQWGPRYIACNHLSDGYRKVAIRNGDVLLLPDASWLSDDLEKRLHSVRSEGGKIVFLLHDIIPIRHPHFCDPYHNRLFSKWLTEIVFAADCIISVTETVAQDTAKYMDEIEYPVEKRPVMRWSHSGVALAESAEEESDYKFLFNFNFSPSYLSVGAIEPKKNYSMILDAVEQAWNEGADFNYIIVGSYGWGQNQVKNRILEHEEFGERLFWLQMISDTELVYLYNNCHYLIQGSVAEGFGLPVVEAARYGLSSICSDIPALKEITRGKALYFKNNNSSDLAEILKQSSKQEKIICNLEPDTWDVSAQRTINLLEEL